MFAGGNNSVIVCNSQMAMLNYCYLNIINMQTLAVLLIALLIFQPKIIKKSPKKAINRLVGYSFLMFFAKYLTFLDQKQLKNYFSV